MTTDVKLVLGSGSPRRKALLNQVGIQAQVLVPEIDESWYPSEDAIDYVRRMAREKLEACLRIRKSDAFAWVICADTIVVLGEKVLGKPADPQDNLNMLEALSNQSHQVITAVSLGHHAPVDSIEVSTEVHFADLSPDICARYVATNEGSDKAGGYAIQGLGGAFVERIVGSYSNVVGLPLSQTTEMLCRNQVLREWP